jgi:cytochrome P450
MESIVMTPPDDVFSLFVEPLSRIDPYGVYTAYRAERRAVAAGGLHFLFAYDDCLSLLRDRRTSVDERRAVPPGAGDELPTLIHLDPPDHDRLRRLVQAAFTPRRVDGMRTSAELLVKRTLDQFGPGDVIDVVAELAHPLPLAIICDLLGVPVSDRPIVGEWSTWLGRSIDPDVFRNPELNDRIAEAQREFSDYVGGLIDDRRRRPGTDLFSQLVSTDLDGDRLTRVELIGLAVLLLVAGHETTSSLIGNGLLALLRDRTQFDRVAHGTAHGTAHGAIDEILRYDSPVQMTSRIALEPLRIGDHEVGAGEICVLMIGSANRDEAVFENADRLDVATPRSTAHLAFGHGLHHCLGAALARTEAEIALRLLTCRFPNMELQIEPALRPTFVLRGYESVTVSLA